MNFLPNNIRFLRKTSRLSQEKFGALFGATRGMIDSYERTVAPPSHEFIKKLSNYYNISITNLTEKDLQANPGLLNTGKNDNSGGGESDIIKAKDELIKELRQQLKFSQQQIERQNEIIETLTKKS